MHLLPDIVNWMITSTIVSGIGWTGYAGCRRWLTATERYAIVRGAMLGSPLLPLLLWAELSFTTAAPQSTASASTAARSLAIAVGQLSWQQQVLGWIALIAILAYVVAAVVLCGRLVTDQITARCLTRSSVLVFTRDGIPVATHHSNLPPMAVGLLRPTILIPAPLLDAEHAGEFEMILAHELIHVRRRDCLTKVGVRLLQALMCFSPFAHLLARACDEEMEESCDALVLRIGIEPKAYGLLLLRMACGAGPGKDLLGSGIFSGQSITSRRIKAMASKQKVAHPVRVAATAALIGALTVPALAKSGIKDAVDERVASPVGATDSSGGFGVHVELVDNGQRYAKTLPGKWEGDLTFKVGPRKMGITRTPIGDEIKYDVMTFDLDTGSIQSDGHITVASAKDSFELSNGSASSRMAKDGSGTAGGNSLIVRVGQLSQITNASSKSRPGGSTLEPSHFYFNHPTEVRDTIKDLARLTGRNVILAREAKGTIMLPASPDDDRTLQQALDDYEQALNKVGLALTDDGKVLRIGPSKT